MTAPTKEKSPWDITPKGFSEQRDQNMHQSKSAPPDGAASFFISQGLIDRSPIAYAVARRGRSGQWSWIVERCPLCAQRHSHGGGDGEAPALLGHRVAHCGKPGASSGYILAEVAK